MPQRPMIDSQAVQQIQQQLHEGFSGINKRLDTLNGRMGKVEVSSAVNETEIDNLKTEVYRRKEDQVKLAPPVISTPQKVVARHVITERDVKIVWMTLAAIIAVIEGLFRLGPVLIRLLKGL